ncbi:MAG: hypothetical protein WDN47_03645 [Candidatus Doudnabacteria bacterium]
MTAQDFLTKLQKQPYNTRVKILWGSVVVAAIILFGLWVLTLRSSIKHLDTSDLLKSPSTAGANSTKVNYAAVERVDTGSGNLKIFFNFNNTTDDILNVSSLSNISLTANGASIAPSQMTDRQGKPFVQKILSHTQNFGILVFPKIDGASAQLTFDQMFFEGSPDQILSQKLDLDLKKLGKPNNLRN